MENKKRSLIGTVVSDKMQSTAVVEVGRVRLHARYRKFFKVTKRIKCHNAGNQAKMGDVVEMQETRPLSKEKRWQIVKILTNGKRLPIDKEPGEVLRP